MSSSFQFPTAGANKSWKMGILLGMGEKHPAKPMCCIDTLSHFHWNIKKTDNNINLKYAEVSLSLSDSFTLHSGSLSLRTDEEVTNCRPFGLFGVATKKVSGTNQEHPLVKHSSASISAHELKIPSERAVCASHWNARATLQFLYIVKVPMFPSKLSLKDRNSLCNWTVCFLTGIRSFCNWIAQIGTSHGFELNIFDANDANGQSTKKTKGGPFHLVVGTHKKEPLSKIGKR